ncbi:hypothetical protein BTJ40_12970 [Microbulbifer sp. A4B17]|uniref:DUF6896 domain-containing protein n=1 Tax=Microbulbifer sp. A4B17 TaxID=359370 RepID=UPI000D52E6C6|nr:hypothetical protein [Microbulbifer sp. A4B17]AWF81664.1 hypothetical protein BTJ40_12970 [Microbulbifer sp. A4B17]
MNRELKEIIDRFNEAQETAVNILESVFECPRPVSAMDFTTRCKQELRDKNYQCGGYKIRPHGIGMEVNVNGIKIDFDFGHNGEINGFDAWRLYNFVNQNNIKSPLNSEGKIKAAFELAVFNGFIYKGTGMGSNHYVSS